MDFELLYKYFDGFTTHNEEIAIRVWLESSPENKKIFLEARKMYDAIMLNETRISKETSRSNYAETSKVNRKSFYLKEFGKIAAIAVITVLCTWFFLSGEKIEANPVAFQTITVPAGQRINLELPDGTNVWLNAKTTLKYPVSFNSKERLVNVDGQAYFEVAKNEKVPFIVRSSKGLVRALGTKFDVLDYSDNEVFEAMLMEGSVKVDLNNNPNESIILSPEKKAFLKNGKLESVHVSDMSAYLWREGLISFRNETFENILKSFEKTYDITIIIENNNQRDLSFTGKFRFVDGVEYALKVLQREVKFKYERDSDKNIIYIK